MEDRILIFNSFYRSANVFLCFLANRMIDCAATTEHDYNLYSDKSKKQVVMIRNPYESIASCIHKRRVDGKSILPTDKDSYGIEKEIELIAEEYLNYLESTKNNFNNIYVQNFEEMKKDPFQTMKNIASFHNLELRKEFNSSYEEVYEQIKDEMFATRTDIQEHLMTMHDGHLPRDKNNDRIIIEKYVNDPNIEIMKKCFDTYNSMIYTLNLPHKLSNTGRLLK